MIMLVRKILSDLCYSTAGFCYQGRFRLGCQESYGKEKKQDFSKAEFFFHEEGLCVQCMHIGAYDDEPVTVDAMHRFMEEQGYALDITDRRMHHEIYLSDARKVAGEAEE